MAKAIHPKAIQFQPPSYTTFVTDVTGGIVSRWKLSPWRDFTPAGWLDMLNEHGTLTIHHLIAVIVYSMMWGALKSAMTKHIFQRIVDASTFDQRESRSLKGSLWKLIFVSVGWLLSAHLVLNKYELFFYPSRTIFHWTVDVPMTWDIYTLYMYQLSFYAYSTYETIFVDKRSKHFVIILLHHFIAMLLMCLSFAFRYVYIGILVLFLHDLSEVFLEISKITSYYKKRKGILGSILGVVSNGGFVAFGISWFLFRLYWFPLKAIYAGAYMSAAMYPDTPPPFYFLLNGLLLFLLGIHAYKFKFILELIYRVLTGASRDIDYVRDYNENGFFLRDRKNSSHKLGKQQ